MVLIYDCIEECNKCYGHCTTWTSRHFEIHCLQQQMHENSHQASFLKRFLYSYVDEYLSTDHQFVSHFNEHQLSLRPSSCHFDFRFRALCTSPLVLIFQLWPFQYQISPFYFHMFVDPLPATSTLGATLLGATLGAGEVATLTGQVQTVTQILAVVQQNPILIIHLVLLDTEENRNLHLIITSLNTVKPWYSKYAYNKFTLAGKSLLFPLLKIWTTRYKLFKYNKLCH